MVRYFRIGLMISLAALLISTSCTKSEFNGPILVNDPVNLKRAFTINPGESVPFTSKFEEPESLTYEWSIDGVKKADSGSAYTFTSTEPGSYIITQKITNAYGEVYIDYYVVVRGAYDKGSFLFNNNTGEASITYLNKDFTSVEENAYATVNPGKTLGARVTSVQAFNGKFYIISSTEGLIVVNSITLKEVGRIAKLPANANNFLGIDRSTALLSTDDGIYKVNLNPLSLGERIPGIGGRVGIMVNTPSYIHALTLTNGVVVISKSKLLVSKILRVGRAGLTTDMSGNVWTSHADTLYSISSSLYVVKHLMPKTMSVTSSWNPWNEGSLCASGVENALFFIGANTNGKPSQDIFKIDVNSISNITSKVFITLPAGRSFSGIGIRINNDNNIVASTVSSTGTDPAVVVFRAGDGSPVKTISVASTETQTMLFNNVK